jgi:hypothetical protein
MAAGILLGRGGGAGLLDWLCNVYYTVKRPKFGNG